ncbi:hypothetical protein BH11PLA2_BH11PLA2_05440 [soil metagenome]
MANVTGRRIPLSLPRRWIDDLMRASRGRPIISFERRMNLAPLIAARKVNRISWTVLFAKAYGILCTRRPELRRAYVSWPWPHLFESDMILPSIAIERKYEGESAVFFGIYREPHTHTLAVMQHGLEGWKNRPIANVKQFQRLIWYTRFPRHLRRLLWWYAITSSGQRRARNCGTFGISSTAATGSTALNLISPVATSINYTPLEPDGSLTVRLHFDHRVMDGLTAASVLDELELILNGEIRDELTRVVPGEAVTESQSLECVYQQ